MTTATITSKQLTDRVTAVLVALTPTLAATALFAEHSDNTTKLEHVTDPGRLRLIKVTLEEPRISAFAAAALNTTNFDKVLKIRVGYPAEDFETIDDVEYNVEELKGADLELIRRTLDATSTVFPVATYPGVKRLTFDVAREAFNGRVRDITYGVSFGRST